MPTFEIACPHHGGSEQVSVPDSYLGPGRAWQGEIPCGSGDEPMPLQVSMWMDAEGVVTVASLMRAAPQ